MTTGLTPASFDHLQLGAGMFLTSLDLTDLGNAAALRERLRQAVGSNDHLGATRGGGTFRCSPQWRHLEADGLRGHAVGATVCDGWTVKLTGTLLEFTPRNLSTVLGAADATSSGGVTVIRPRMRLQESDHLSALYWVGDVARGLMVIELTGALNLSGANFTFTDKGEGTLPFEFLAHADSPGDVEYAPCRILFLEEEAQA